jgi:triacylglycerol esterase/lipase EstA (alpha/beta hydrolase family)
VRIKKLVASALVALLAATAVGAVGASPAAAATPDPVIIVAGTSANQTLASVFYAPMAARLRANGYRVYIFGLPGGGLGDIAATSGSLNTFSDQVRAQTGAARVDLIGHSQGGLVGRYYIKNLGGSAEVDSMISLGAPHYGTSLANVARFLGLGNCLGVVACNQMAIGSSFLNSLNAGDDTIGNVRYTNLATKLDEVVTPYTTAFLANDGNNTNVAVQSQCWARLVGHVTLATDGTVYSGILDALRKQPITLSCFAL